MQALFTILVVNAALFVIAKTWKKPKCSSVNEYKVWYMPYNGILFSLRKE